MKQSPPQPAYGYREIRAVLGRDAPPDHVPCEVARLVGLELLAYVAAAAPTEIAAQLAGTRELKRQQSEALSCALAFAWMALDLRRESASNDSAPRGTGESAFEVLTELFGGRARNSELGFADALRLHAGGRLPGTPAAPDPVTAFLLGHARASYGALLVKRSQDEILRPAALSRVGRVPLDQGERWRAVLGEDRELAVLFPDLSDIAADSRQYFDSSGQGGSIQAVFIPELVVRAAARRAGWPDGLDAEAYFDHVVAIVQELRRLVAGEIVEVPAWVFVVGRDVPHGFRLPTPLGTLRAASAPPLVPATANPDPRLLIELSYPLSLEFDYPSGGPVPGRVFGAQREFQRRIDHVRLAFLLAHDCPDPLALQVASREISNPLGWSSVSWPWSVPPFSVPFAHDDAARLARWSELIARRHHASIELAGRRALSAATPGREAEDRLVDAVIGLENLVGQGAGMKPGRAFRAAVPALLTDDAIRQQQFGVRAEALYKARSEIVHGKRELDVLDAEQLRAESLRMLLGGLRRLFAELPALIPDRRRARRLLATPDEDHNSKPRSS